MDITTLPGWQANAKYSQNPAVADAILSYYKANPIKESDWEWQTRGDETTSLQQANDAAIANAMAKAGYRQNTNAGNYDGRSDTDIKSLWDAQKLPYNMSGNWIGAAGDAQAPHALDAGSGDNVGKYMLPIMAAALTAGAGGFLPGTESIFGGAGVAGGEGAGSLVGGAGSDTLGGITDFGQLVNSPGASLAPGYTNATGSSIGAGSFAGGAGVTAPYVSGGGLLDALQNLPNVPTSVPKDYSAYTGETPTAPVNAVPDNTISPSQVNTNDPSWKKIIDGTASASDWMKVMGQAAPGILGALSSNSQAGALQKIADQQTAQRKPFLDAATAALSPDWYKSPEAMGSLDTILRKLSVGGNISDPTKLGLASQAFSGQRLNNIGVLGNLGLSGQSGIIGSQTNAVNQDGQTYANLGSAASSVFNPQSSLTDLLRQFGGGTFKLADGSTVT